MRKIRLLPLVLFFLPVNGFAQGVWTDTLRTYVDLSKFKLGKKVVNAGYGQAIMYFSQKDYFGEEAAADTIKLLPRFFKEDVMSDLMKQGKVRIIERSNDSAVQKISHRMVQYGSMVDRVFKLEDGTEYFRHLEITGLMINWDFSDSTKQEKTNKVIPKKEFEVPEEFPNLKDHEKIKFREYFPIDTTLNNVYRNSWNSYGDLDTVGCRETVYEGQKIFYFPYKGYVSYNLVDIKMTSFGGGFYFYRNDSLFVLKGENESDLKPDTDGFRFNVPHVKNASLIIPAYIIPGDSIVLIRGLLNDNRQVYTYLAKEDVTIGKTVYTDCVKFKMLSYWDEEIYLSYIWFKKDIGMVKWSRGTGRIDELVNRYKH